MSVTVADLMRLPSFYHAEVLAGKGGLGKAVSTVSVLETVDPALIDSRVNKTDRIGGGEIVITSFVNAPEDEELQLRIVRQLAESGEIGLIIYYVGVFLKNVPRKILDYGDENDFVIICMPRNQENLRYSDAISDIMGAVIHDRESGRPLVVSLLDDMARLPAAQRSTAAMVRLISERLRCSVVLTDGAGVLISESAWPGEYRGISRALSPADHAVPSGLCVPYAGAENCTLLRQQIRTVSGAMHLFFLGIGTPPDPTQTAEAAETIRIAVNIWDTGSRNAPISELVRAILNDDPLRMRTLASLFRKDIASISAMWLFSGERAELSMAQTLSDTAGNYCRTSFADLYNGEIVLFTDAYASLHDAETVLEAAAGILPKGFRAALFTNLKDTADVRTAYTLYHKEMTDALRILPGRSYYTEGDLCFAESCRGIIEAGENEVKQVLSRLNAFDRLRDRESIAETLSVYLLDTDQSLLKTAEAQYLHKNTIKYRLKIMSDCLGYPVGSMPASVGLYQAVGLMRLLRA